MSRCDGGGDLSILITLPFPPSANTYWRHNRGRTHRSDEANKYIKDVDTLCKEAGLEPFTCRVVVSVDFFRPQRRGDLDNMLKVLIDALRGHGYVDDSQIVGIYASRHDDKKNPRAQVVIDEVHG